MSLPFEMAAGSVMGREHQRTGRNNQDAWQVHARDRALVAVVCDGCGSSPRSEVGAQLGARLVTGAIALTLPTTALDDAAFWPTVRETVLAQLHNLLPLLGDDPVGTVAELLLFTVAGAVLTPEVTTLFAIGDGACWVNGENLSPPPFPGNAPPYLAYALIPEWVRDFDPAETTFQVQGQLPTNQVRSLLVGTDGVHDLAQAAGQCLPGQETTVGPLAQFWEDNRYFHNPDQVRRRLTQLNRSIPQPDWEQRTLHHPPGLLPDDTTLIVVRRRR